MSRQAFYIIGPESSGTRMLTKAFINVGCFGDGSHVQRMDHMNFANMPDVIVYRNSVPHATVTPPIAQLYRRMGECGYTVFLIIIDREDYYMELSQVKRWHQEDVDSARESIALAREYIAKQVEELGIQPILVQYENFVGSAEVRRKFFEAHSLPEPNMYFWNANDTYK